MQVFCRGVHQQISNVRVGTVQLPYLRDEISHILNCFCPLSSFLHKLVNTLSIFEVDHRY